MADRKPRGLRDVTNRSTTGAAASSFAAPTKASKRKKPAGSDAPRVVRKAPVPRKTESGTRVGRAKPRVPTAADASRSSAASGGQRKKKKLSPDDLHENLRSTKAEMLRLKETLERDLASVEASLDSGKPSVPEIVLEVDHEKLKQFEEEKAAFEVLVAGLEKRTLELTAEIAALTAQQGVSTAQLDALKCSHTALQQQYAEVQTADAVKQERLRLLETQLATATDRIAAKEQEIAGIEAQNREIAAKMADVEKRNTFLEEKSRHDDLIRRKLHNTILELKGNIRVFCRVRPAPACEVRSIEFEEDDFEHTKLTLRGDEAQKFDGTVGDRKAYGFEFDRVFNPGNSQRDVFDEVSQLVQSALDGYKVSIFAYGQTGSGKTFTMEGPPGLKFDSVDSHLDERRGIIPRAVEQIFASLTAFQSKGWAYTCKAMFVEIYNDTICDLLGDPSAEKTEHSIKHGAGGSTEITGVNLLEVTDAGDIYPLLAQSKKNRSVGQTKMNNRSSRSHCVFQLQLTGVNKLLGQTSNGVLNLIDLAGSERLKESGVQNDKKKMKETTAINSSLSCLGDVITSLINKSKHVPYRNSTLTWLLKNCFGGDGKTLMLVNLSPEPVHSNESLCALRFASKVNSCNIGSAKRSVK